jgi:transcriptional regulator with XRE-family HTH domain
MTTIPATVMSPNGVVTPTPNPERVVLRCKRCGLNQFSPLNRKCRRCRSPLWEEQGWRPASFPLEEPQATPRNFSPDKPFIDFGGAVRLLRLCSGLAQRDIAAKSHVPRSYISKIERSWTPPSIPQVYRLADALAVSPYLLIVIATSGVTRFWNVTPSFSRPQPRQAYARQRFCTVPMAERSNASKNKMATGHPTD